MAKKVDGLDPDSEDFLEQLIDRGIRTWFSGESRVPDDWDRNSDVAVPLMNLAAKIAVAEETAMPGMGGGEPLFVEWAQRAYRAAKKAAQPTKVPKNPNIAQTLAVNALEDCEVCGEAALYCFRSKKTNETRFRCSNHESDPKVNL